jgi:AcrR family transcriptional regulator
MAERSAPHAPRRRLPAEAARARILEAAELKLAAVGPERLRLTELAAELGVSHPAILHHFGSREELVAAVVERATLRLNERLAQVMAGRDHLAIFDMIAEFYSGEGNARLIAWLVLSGLTPKAKPRSATARPLQHLVKLAHAQRTRAHPERNIDYADTEFRAQLTSLALLGEAIFGDLIRYGCGSAQGPKAAREFRRRLAKLLLETP